MKRFPVRKKLFKEFKKQPDINEDCSDINSSNDNFDIPCVENIADFPDSKKAEYEIELRHIDESEKDEYEIKNLGVNMDFPKRATKAESDFEYAQILSRIAKQKPKNRQKKDIAIDSTEREKLRNGCVVGLPSHIMFKDTSGPTSYANRNVMLGTASRAFRFITDNQMVNYIKTHRASSQKYLTIGKLLLKIYMRL